MYKTVLKVLIEFDKVSETGFNTSVNVPSSSKRPLFASSVIFYNSCKLTVQLEVTYTSGF